MAVYKLKDICLKIGSGATPRGGKEAYCDEGISLIRSQNVLDFTFSHDGLAHINEKQAEKLSNVEVKSQDILLNITGDSVARACAVDVRVLPARVNQHVAIIRPDENMVLSSYILYFLQMIKPYLLQIAAGGATRNALTKSMIENLEIEVPGILSQKKIVSVLDDIQEKIRDNNEINKNLEQQALAIFRQYFMDFAPYGGVAPSDWMEVSLDDVCIRITDGSHYSPADSPDSPYPMYSVKDMETYGFNSSTCKHITEDEFRKMKKSDCVPLLNDILVAKDGSYLKEIFICSEEKEEAILSSIAIFRPNTSVIMPEILLYFLKQPSVRKDVGDNYVSGSALPRIVLKDFKKYRLTLPTMNEQLKIGSVLHAIRMQTKANIDEIQRLSSIRDTLLPQLMSGNLDVSALDI